MFCYLGQQMPKFIFVPIPEGLILWDVTCHLNIKGMQEKELKWSIKFRVSAFMCIWNFFYTEKGWSIRFLEIKI
jgi:hypothetical protein